MIWWLRSIRIAWGQKFRGQQSCWFKGEIKITPAVTALLQSLCWMEGFGSRNITESNMSNKKCFETLQVLLLRDQDGQSIQFYDKDQYSRVNNLSQSWSWHGTDFLLHFSNHTPADVRLQFILQSAKQMHSPQMAHSFWKDGSIWGHGSPTYCETEGVKPVMQNCCFSAALFPNESKIWTRFLWATYFEALFFFIHCFGPFFYLIRALFAFLELFSSAYFQINVCVAYVHLERTCLILVLCYARLVFCHLTENLLLCSVIIGGSEPVSTWAIHFCPFAFCSWTWRHLEQG